MAQIVIFVLHDQKMETLFQLVIEKFVFLVITICISAEIVHAQKCSFSDYSNTELLENSLADSGRIEEVRSSIECSVLCVASATCDSIYYDERTNICRLLPLHAPKQAPMNSGSGYSSAVFEPLNSGSDCQKRCDAGTECNCDGKEVYCIEENSRTCPDMGVISTAYHMVPANDKDSGVIKTVKFDTQYDFTAVRVGFRGTLRGAYYGNSLSGGQCTRWWFAFDGEECRDPDVIDFVEYHASRFRNFHRASQFDGICKGLATGSITITLHVGICTSYRYITNAKTASHGGALYVEEVDVRDHPGIGPCPLLSTTNIKYYISRTSSGTNSGLVKRFYYTKQDPNTALRILWIGSLRVQTAQGGNRWFFTFNGNECTSPHPIDTLVYLGTPTSFNHLLTSPIDGICKGLPAGNIYIDLKVNQTLAKRTLGDAYTTWNSPSRLIVEEINLGQLSETVSTSTHLRYKQPVVNKQFWSWHKMNNGIDSGVIKEVAYKKNYNMTALRVKWSGVLRVYTGSSSSACALWFFTFNKQSCTDPQEIKGRVSMNTYSTNYYRPGTVDGICKGLQSGTITVALNVSACPGYTGGKNAYTGYDSASYLYVEEIYL